MVDEVRDSHDTMAKRYVSFALGDLGCGPGYMTNHLDELGLLVVGYDISPNMVDEARRLFPQSMFEIGDLRALNIADSSIAGIASRYLLIHIFPTRLEAIFVEWFRVLKPGGPILVSFFVAPWAELHGSPFGYAVATAYQLSPETVAGYLLDAGFSGVQVATRDPLEGERRLEHGTILAQKLIG